MSLFRCLVLAAGLLAGSLAVSLATAQTTYRWLDASGQTVYSDQPPPAGAKQVVKISGEASGDETQMPFATRQAVEKYPVTLYTAANCVEICQNARDLLNRRGVPFTEKLATNDAETTELFRRLGSEAGFPSVFVGQQGFKGYEAESWNNLLDLAGYPKTAPYGAKPSGAFAK